MIIQDQIKSIKHRLRYVLLACVWLPIAVSFAVSSSFRVQQIKVVGMRRVPASTIINYVPLKQGQRYHPGDSTAILQRLYNTGYFSDISLARRGNTLIIRVVERPTIGLVRVIGNKSLPNKQLHHALKQVGLVTGKVLDASKLKSIVDGLRQQYFDLGHYNAQVVPQVMSRPRNRVAVLVHVTEGPVAKIEGIRIVGNHVFTQRQLLREFKLSTPTILSSLSHNDEYSKQKLDADIENMTSYYMDRGYLHFNVLSQQVSIAADGAGIYIVIGVSEGSLYHFSGFQIANNPLGRKAQMEKLITIHAGDVFSRSVVIQSSNAIHRYLGDLGYAFSVVNPEPDVDDSKHLVYLRYQVLPGQKIYVRRIEFLGNNATREQVFRQQFLQLEDSQYNLSKLNESKRRIANLPYIANVQTQLQPVIGANNQADIKVHVKPQNAGKATVQVGYSDTQGFLYGANLTEPNFLGTGHYTAISFQRSAYQNSYMFNYANPYASRWGVSRNFGAYYSETKPDSNLNLAPFNMNSYGFSAGSGIPLDDHSSASLGLSFEHDQITLSGSSPQEYINFINQVGDTKFDQLGLNLDLTRSNYNMYPFPTSGTSNDIGAKIWFPVSKPPLSYYTLSYAGQMFIPLYKQFIANAKLNIDYGGGIGKTKELPFFRNFYAGGINSVPGFSPNSLGPSDQYDNALGGNLSLVAQTGLIFPNGISKNLRTALVVSAGNVFDESKKIDLHNLRYSVGVNATVIMPFLGAIQLGVALPFNVGSDKHNVSVFGFSMGTGI